MRWIKQRRRSQLRKRPFPPTWNTILERSVPIYPHLPAPDQQELKRHIQVFLSEKRFEGAAGLQMTDEIRVCIAAHACILLLHRNTDYYPALYSVIVYPHTYLAKRSDRDPLGLVTERLEPRAGESWTLGTVVLAWDAVARAVSSVAGCRNVAFHEFAHQLDGEDGQVNGAPILSDRSQYEAWERILGREYQQLKRDVQQGSPTILHPYGATNPAEFFAVVTECFFTHPGPLRQRHPKLYAQLRHYFRQDPVRFLAEEAGDRTPRS